MQHKRKTPVIILNGFLGSGKTTLFRNLLSQSQKQDLLICAVVNDMSELDIDGEIIADTSAIESNQHSLQSISSCVLSSQKGLKQLDHALDTLLEQQPDLIIIETSGSCHPLPLIEFFQSQTHLKLTGILVLMDSLMLANDYDDGKLLVPQMQHNLNHQHRDTTNLLIEQMLFCSHLLLTKADRLHESQMQRIAQAIHPINPYVSILSMLFGNLSLSDILDMPEYNYHRVAQLIAEIKPELAIETSQDRPYNLATRVLNDERPFHPQRLWEVCHKHLDQRIYRSKGFFWLPGRDTLSLLWNQSAGSVNLEIKGHWRAGILQDANHNLSKMEVDLLKKRLEQTSGRFGDRHCNLTVIGDRKHVDHFTKALATCFLTEEEIIAWKSGKKFPDPWPNNIVKMVNE